MGFDEPRLRFMPDRGIGVCGTGVIPNLLYYFCLLYVKIELMSVEASVVRMILPWKVGNGP